MDTPDRLLLSPGTVAPVSVHNVQTAMLDAEVLGRRTHLADLPDVVALGCSRFQDRYPANGSHSRVAHHLGSKAVASEGIAIET